MRLSPVDLIAWATQKMTIKVFNIDAIVKAVKKDEEACQPHFHLNVGSQATQYTMEKSDNEMYPGRERGVSNLLVSLSKVVVTIDQVIRVYSYDATSDSDTD